MSSSITINGNVNIYINGDSAELEVNDDLTAENIVELIQGLFNVPSKEKKLDLNPNAPEFVPSRHCQCECKCDSDDDSNYSDDSDDSDYDYEDDEMDEDDEIDEEDDEVDVDKLNLFKDASKSSSIKYSYDLFKKYCDWAKKNGKGLNRYKKMKDFLKNNSNADAVPAPAPAAVPAPAAAPAPAAPVEKKEQKEEPKRDAVKISLFRQLCDENDIDYSVKLFDKYEEWSKSNGSGLNRYKKMTAFLKSHSKA